MTDLDEETLDAIGLNPVCPIPTLPPGRQWLGEFTAAELSNEAYHAGPGISKSHLDTIAEGSPAHYWQKYLNPERPPKRRTPALALGDCIHAAILQPGLFESRYAPTPEGLDKRTKIGKETWAWFQREHAGKTHLSHAEYEICLGIRDAVHRHPVARGLFQGGQAEHSFFAIDPETRELRKCRPDYLADDYVIDLKSTLDAGEDPFSRDATNFRYDVAVPWYLDIINLVRADRVRRRKWIWLAVEKSPPYAIAIYYAQDQDIIAARDTARRDFHKIIKHRQLNAWPDYGETMRPLVLKPWKKR